MTHVIKTITKPIVKLVDHIPGGNIIAPIALTALGQPELAAAFAGANTLDHGGSLGKSLLSAGLSYGGAALGGSDTVFGDSISGALKDGISGLSDSIGSGLGKVGDATGLTSLYNDASGLTSDAYHSASDALSSAYNGSGLQSAFDSGKSALNSLGLGSGSSGALSGSSTAPLGGGGSSYGDDFTGGVNNPAKDFLNSNTNDISNIGGTTASLSSDALSNPSSDFLNNNLNDIQNIGGNLTPSASTLSGTGGKVASNSLLSPLASIGIGSYTNSNALDALLAANKQNKSLLAPYANGFSFTPGDLTQDPGYQFNLAQGNQALDRKQLASGNYFSGAALKDAQQFGQGLADNTYNASYNRALQGFGTGLTGASTAAGVNSEGANAKANSIINQGNLYSGALGNILGGQAYTNSGALSGGIDQQSIIKKLLGLQ